MAGKGIAVDNLWTSECFRSEGVQITWIGTALRLTVASITYQALLFGCNRALVKVESQAGYPLV